MLYHEESPEKPQYNIAIPPFLDNPPPFSRINFRTRPTIPPIWKNSNPPPPPLNEGGWGEKGGARTILASTDIDRIIESSL